MSEYVFAYHGGKQPESPEAGAALMARWNAWIGEMGDTMINPGTPMGSAKTVSSEGVSDGGGANPLMGFSIVRADNLDAAIEIAKGCPHLELGTIEVAEAMEMPTP